MRNPTRALGVLVPLLANHAGAVTVILTTTTTLTPLDSFELDISGGPLPLGSLKPASSDSLDTNSASGTGSGSGHSSGSNASGSSGLFFQVWQWFVLLGCCFVCCAAVSVSGKNKTRKKGGLGAVRDDDGDFSEGDEEQRNLIAISPPITTRSYVINPASAVSSYSMSAAPVSYAQSYTTPYSAGPASISYTSGAAPVSYAPSFSGNSYMAAPARSSFSYVAAPMGFNPYGGTPRGYGPPVHSIRYRDEEACCDEQW